MKKERKIKELTIPMALFGFFAPLLLILLLRLSRWQGWL